MLLNKTRQYNIKLCFSCIRQDKSKLQIQKKLFYLFSPILEKDKVEIIVIVYIREKEREMFYLTTHSTHFI